MTVHFTPAGAGGWQALCSGPRLLVLGATVPPERLEALWAAVEDRAGFQSVLDVLTSDGLSATPPFALLDVEESEAEESGLRAVLRGRVTATVATASGEEPLDGAGVSTWVERRIADAISVSLAVTGAVAVDEAGTLPLRNGAAWVARLDFIPGREPAPARESAVVAGSAAQTPATTPDSRPAPVSEATVTDVVGLPPATEETAVREPAAPNPLGDHDGQTVMTSDIAALRAGRRAPKLPAPPPQQQATSLFLSVSSGEREPLTQPILVGRAPSVSKVSGDQIPRLLRVGTADQDISRNHARIALEGDTVVVTDLHSRNGTMIVLPGKEPQKLRAGEPTSVIVGTVVDLGGGVTLTVDEG